MWDKLRPGALEMGDGMRGISYVDQDTAHAFDEDYWRTQVEQRRLEIAVTAQVADDKLHWSPERVIQAALVVTITIFEMYKYFAF